MLRPQEAKKFVGSCIHSEQLIFLRVSIFSNFLNFDAKIILKSILSTKGVTWPEYQRNVSQPTLICT